MSTIKQEKEIKGIRIRKVEIKFSLLSITDSIFTNTSIEMWDTCPETAEN